MKMSNSLSATRDYFNSLNSKIGEPLAFLLNQNIHDGSDILVTEQVIQDFLASAFQPFVGAFRVPTYIYDQAPLSFHQLAESSQSVIEGAARFGLIGAHYRSSLSAKGRRSAFAVNRRVHCKSLRNFLGDHPYFALRGRLSSDALDALWEAVFLEQYFSLFDRKLTLGEWTFEHNKKIPIVILSESGASSAKIAAFRAESYFKQVVVLPTHLTNILLNDEMLAEFMRGVADGICSSFKRDAEAVRRSGEGYPTSANINSWSRLVRSANALARDAISRTTLERQLAIRHSYATGLLLYNDSERRLRDQLHLLFPSSTTGSPGRDGLVEVEQLSRLLRVFQSLQFYTRRYGENCVTLPQPVANRGRRLLGEGFQSSVTLFWNGGHHLSLLREIDSGVRGLLGHVTALVDGYLRDRRPGRGNMRNQDRDVVERIQKDSDNRLAGQEVHEVLAIAHDLSRALHEGRPRAFSFILGSPEWLIADLAVVHDLMIGNRYQFADNPNQRHAYARTIAILRGNSAFFQDESVALFIPSPGLPLEVTHVVRLPWPGTGRRQQLLSFTKGKKGVVAIATYGFGTGEVIHDGEVRAVLSSEGEWVPAKGYEDLIEKIASRLAALDEKSAPSVVAKLEPCLRRISEEPGVGGLFVIAGDTAARKLRDNSVSLTEVLEAIDGRPLSELDPRAVYDLARDDGATIIGVPSMFVWGRRFLLPSGALGRQRGSREVGPRLDWLQTLEWGTRRRTALRVSQNLGQDGLVIVISADGPINLLQSGAIVAQFGERSLTPPNGAEPGSEVLFVTTRDKLP